MRVHCHISLLLFCLFLISCSKIPNELRVAEELLKTKPDSSLFILQNLPPELLKSESNRAYYGLLLFQALDRNNKSLQHDSIIDYSLNYFLKKNKKHELAISYYYKARLCKKYQKFDRATAQYIKALDLLKGSDDYFLGKINSDMGDICAYQKEYDEALSKYLLALNYFQHANDTLMCCYQTTNLGRIYRFKDDYIKALEYYKETLNLANDSLTIGTTFQEMGINYFDSNKLDSAKYYLLKSLRYPYFGNSSSIRHFFLANAYYETCKYDSACYFATTALKYHTTFFIQRDCYRILANSEYNLGDFDKMGIYLEKYQDYSDSIRDIESQTKSNILENLHDTTKKANGTKRHLLIIFSVLITISLLLLYFAYFLYKRNNSKKNALNKFKEQMFHKQTFVIQGLSTKIQEMRDSQALERKNASPDERIRLDKELYEKCLHLNNRDQFILEMNHTFNNIVDILQHEHPTITHKEITWCCLHLLKTPNSDIMMLLNITSESFYKLKQRLAKKLNLKNTKQLDSFLQELALLKN